MNRPLLTALVLLIAGWSLLPFQVSLDRYDIGTVDGMPVMTWMSRVEEGLRHYEVHRLSQSSSGFETIGKVDATGAGSNYEFVDRKLYKVDETVQYKLFAVSQSGQYQEFPVKHISYSPTAVRRTWGSIKAMFQ